MTTNYDKAQRILMETDQGAELDQTQRTLVDTAKRGFLSPAEQTTFEELYERLTNDGTYLFGIRHLTKNHNGFVFWKNVQVEHYSHQDADAMKRDAEKLAALCLALEVKGFPVNGRNVLSSCMVDAPADTPWLEAIQRSYTYFVKDDKTKCIFYRYPGDVIIVERGDDGIMVTEVMDEAYNAFHYLQNQGFVSQGNMSTSYSEYVALLERLALTPEQISSALR